MKYLRLTDPPFGAYPDLFVLSLKLFETSLAICKTVFLLEKSKTKIKNKAERAGTKSQAPMLNCQFEETDTHEYRCFGKRNPPSMSAKSIRLYVQTFRK